ncbi:helix-turn-helix domain-containing protein [Streptomyces sp. NPDC056144]|uniref:helix-turn-helix domain-containing protein n=1 Tax=unclassified Streptomyces TaxID=2593676 RepID=UPI0035D7B5D6
MTDPDSSPAAQEARERLAADLRELRRQMPTLPTQAALARPMKCARSTVSVILNGQRFPTWEQMSTLVSALGGNPADWSERWRSTRRQIEEAGRGGAAGPVGAARPMMPARTPSAPLTTPLPQPPTSPLTSPPPPPLDPAAFVGGERLPGIHWFKDNREFYEAAEEGVRGARAEIRVTYTRRYPPDQTATPASRRYFAAVQEWAAADSEDERAVRRIIGVPERDGVPDPDVLAWARRHHAETGGVLNYEAAVLRWTAASADGLNMALIDDSLAFLAFSGGPKQRLNGFMVEHPRFMRYFAAYFDQLWTALPSLAHYLGGLPEGPDGRISSGSTEA